MDHQLPGPVGSDEYAHRLAAARAALRGSGLSALLVTPGPSLRYLSGYDATPLERLTCLLVAEDADPVLVVPQLELAAAETCPAARLGVDVLAWEETADPVNLVAQRLDGGAVLGLDPQMWAEKVLRFRDALPDAELRLADDVLVPLRRRKSPAEVEALREAGAAIDAVHAAMADWLRPGRTERAVARDVHDAILDVGHVQVDFVIVASGPNSASPHHGPGERVVTTGDAVVVDIGGTTAAGYCSDSTRTYQLGNPDPLFADQYAVLRAAQAAAVAAVRPGTTAERIDAVAREAISAAGFGPLFVHRTGHGIGVQTHEEPYLVTGNTQPLQTGMVFSVEPGIYQPGRFGARIEDIVAVTDSGAQTLNNRPRTLGVLD